ncbi:MAG TPA: hypothetical protein VK512_07680, partial [Xanthobacteraceae bacterium]|nr:hypothetical protein [Xanthobacteraceae bacterium]
GEQINAAGARETWERGVQDAHDYLAGCTFNAERANIENVLSLLRDLKENDLWGPAPTQTREA